MAPTTADAAPAPTLPPPTSPWVILGSNPHVVELEGGADVSLALAAPPRVSRLAVSPCVFPDRPTPRNFPFLLATDPSGLLLLSAILDAPLTLVDVDLPGEQSVHWRYSDPRYFVLDAATGSAFRLPDPDPKEPIQHQALVGVLSSPAAAAAATWSQSSCPSWARTRPTSAASPPTSATRVFAPLRTLAHHGRLWWADYSWGVLTADPFADDPVLGFVPLPRPCVLKSREAWGVLDQLRYVGVSAGSLRFVDTYRRGGAPDKVTVWTLRDPDAPEWTLEHQATFADVWADDTYKATGLPKTAPVLALIHPSNPAVVYFFLEDHLFAVDVPARKVVDCERYHLVAPPREYGIVNRFVRDWELPRALSSGPGNWSSDIGLTEPTEAAPPSRPIPGGYHLVGNTKQTFIG
ncbi:unnamed protein product [Miscanthus lutarioriparius]|uniref:DUF1618 domain-containing protein n=1 Tax=Miscanthus lutarioriparius TaxID=422564 RepID=A0A811PFG7_9POAL|nr:unnamed protein product [Miscanthus lutarioriparius]